MAEARAVRELFPGGAVDAKTVLSKAREMEQSDQLFFSRDPYAQRELATNMLAMDPQAFGAMLKVSADLVRERQPELFQAFSSGLATQALAGEGFHEHLGMIAQALENNDLHSLQQLASQLVQWASGSGGFTGQRPPLAEAKTQREQMLERELNSLTLQQSATFSDSINRTVIPQIDAQIHKLIEPVAKGLPVYAREGAIQSLADQIHAGIQQRLKSDNYYHNQVIPLHTSMNYGAQNREVASKIIASRALLHLKPVAKQVLQTWTPRQIDQAKYAAEKAESAARRTDISGGGLTHGRPHAKITKDEARDMSDEQLIDWALKR